MFYHFFSYFFCFCFHFCLFSFLFSSLFFSLIFFHFLSYFLFSSPFLVSYFYSLLSSPLLYSPFSLSSHLPFFSLSSPCSYLYLLLLFSIPSHSSAFLSDLISHTRLLHIFPSHPFYFPFLIFLLLFPFLIFLFLFPFSFLISFSYFPFLFSFYYFPFLIFLSLFPFLIFLLLFSFSYCGYRYDISSFLLSHPPLFNFRALEEFVALEKKKKYNTHRKNSSQDGNEEKYDGGNISINKNTSTESSGGYINSGERDGVGKHPTRDSAFSLPLSSDDGAESDRFQDSRHFLALTRGGALISTQFIRIHFISIQFISIPIYSFLFLSTHFYLIHLNLAIRTSYHFYSFPISFLFT